MEEDGRSTWQDWSVAFKAKAMSSHWEYQESHTLFRLSLQEVSPNAWRKFGDAVTVHHSHLHGTHCNRPWEDNRGPYRRDSSVRMGKKEESL
ncbi:hypothetical protein AYX15_07135 [Cryptococcus neoformans]|nr:hypothetical protein AYX15_07135 [Cryptococcus neoformans var. grubii]